MLTLMIVDDEMWVCALLRQIIDWAACGYELVAEAHEGYEALELIKRHRPDVVLTDIRIPGFDGIAMVESARKQGLDTEFIIISGYEDFEYAKKAIQVGVLDYILKPIEGVYLQELMTRTHNAIMKRRSKENEAVQMKRQLDRSVNRLRDIFLLDVLLGRKTAYEGAELPQVNQEFGLRLQEGVFQTVLFKLETGQSAEHLGQMGQLSLLFKHLLEAQLRDICHEYCIVWANDSRLVCVVNYSLADQQRFNRAIHQIFAEILNKVSAATGMELSAALGCDVPSFWQLADSYENASRALAARIVLEGSRLMEIVSISERESGKERLSLNQEMKLLNLFEAEDREDFGRFVEQLLRSLPMKPEQAYRIYAVARDIVRILYQNWREQYPEMLRELPEEETHDRDMNNARSLDDIIGVILRLAERAWGSCGRKRVSQSSKIVDMAKAYITQNYRNNITLNDAAAAVHVNASYLSDLFRRETGVVFTQYLTEYRMEIAKELLADMRYRIIDVADQAGYKAVNYVRRQFKKVVGISAASYRRMHL